MLPDEEKQLLESQLREAVRHARLRYQDAVRKFHATWGEYFEKHLTEDPTYAIQHARKLESAALEEYVGALKVFTDLVLHGIRPKEDPPHRR